MCDRMTTTRTTRGFKSNYNIFSPNEKLRFSQPSFGFAFPFEVAQQKSLKGKVLGVVSFCCSCFAWLSLAGAFLGEVASSFLKKMKNQPEVEGGEGELGGVTFFLALSFFLLFVLLLFLQIISQPDARNFRNISSPSPQKRYPPRISKTSGSP